VPRRTCCAATGTGAEDITQAALIKLYVAAEAGQADALDGYARKGRGAHVPRREQRMWRRVSSSPHELPNAGQRCEPEHRMLSVRAQCRAAEAARVLVAALLEPT